MTDIWRGKHYNLRLEDHHRNMFGKLILMRWESNWGKQLIECTNVTYQQLREHGEALVIAAQQMEAQESWEWRVDTTSGYNKPSVVQVYCDNDVCASMPRDYDDLANFRIAIERLAAASATSSTPVEPMYEVVNELRQFAQVRQQRFDSENQVARSMLPFAG